MGWKYIMLEATFGETKTQFPIIFPDKMIHIEVATVLKMCGPLDGHSPRVVSAGKIEHVRVLGLGDKSETLNIESRDVDELTINTYSYLHGLL